MGPALLLTILAGCTPWYGEATVARLDEPVPVELVQSQRRFLGISGSKVLFLPYIGCTARLVLRAGETTVELDRLEGRVRIPLIMACPNVVSTELVVSPDGTHIGVRSDRWRVFQRTEQGLFESTLPPDFDPSTVPWTALTDVRTDAAGLLRDPGRDADLSAVLALVRSQASGERRVFLAETAPTRQQGGALPEDDWHALYADLDAPDQEALRAELVARFLSETEATGWGEPRQAGVEGLRSLLLPLLAMPRDIAAFRRLARLGRFRTEEERLGVYASLWPVEPERVTEAACLELERSHLDSTHLLTFLGQTTPECPAAGKRARDLQPCCDDDCLWEATVPSLDALRERLLGSPEHGGGLSDAVPASTYQRAWLATRGDETAALSRAHDRLEYAVEQVGPDCIGVYEPGLPCTGRPAHLRESACQGPDRTEHRERELRYRVDDAARRIHDVKSTGIEPPRVLVTPRSDGDGFTCALDGTPPFYSLLQTRSTEWEVNGAAPSLETDHLPAGRYRPGDRLGCTIVVTRTQVPTLRSLVENRGLARDTRTFTSAVIVAP